MCHLQMFLNLYFFFFKKNLEERYWDQYFSFKVTVKMESLFQFWIFQIFKQNLKRFYTEHHVVIT